MICTAIEWKRPQEAPVDTGDQVERYVYAQAHAVLRMFTMEVMAQSNMNQLSDHSDQSRAIHFVVEIVDGDAVSLDLYEAASANDLVGKESHHHANV